MREIQRDRMVSAAGAVAGVAARDDLTVAKLGDGLRLRRERLRVGRGRVGVGLERGVDFGVVGVEVVHHHAVGLGPLIE